MKTLEIDWIGNNKTLTIKIKPNLLKVTASDDLTETENNCMIAIEEYAEELKAEISNQFRTLKKEAKEDISSEIIEIMYNIFKPLNQ